MFLPPEHYSRAVPVLVGLGFVAAWLSALESRVRWVQRFCAFFGEGCRRTAEFTLFRVPIPWWGVAYYFGLAGTFFLFRPLLYWAIMAGIGIEATFLTIMILIRAACVFCIFNSVVVLLLAVFTFDLGLPWQSAATAVVAFAASLALIGRENRSSLKKPPIDQVLSEIERESEEGKNLALGPSGAAVEVIEFSDYLCPVCRKARTMTKRLRCEYLDRVRWVYMDFPLAMHPGSKELARAPRCAGEQGKFWEFQDLLLAAKGRPARPDLLRYARKLKMDEEKFRACLDSRRHADEVERDIAEGVEARVSATPTYVVNGRALIAPTYEGLKTAIEEALAAARRPADAQAESRSRRG